MKLRKEKLIKQREIELEKSMVQTKPCIGTENIIQEKYYNG